MIPTPKINLMMKTSIESFKIDQELKKRAKERRDAKNSEIDKVKLKDSEIEEILTSIKHKKYPVLNNMDKCKKLQKMGLIKSVAGVQIQSSFSFPFYLTSKGENFIKNNSNIKDLSPAMINVYRELKSKLSKFNNVCVLTASENNDLCSKGILPEENFVEKEYMNTLIVADNFFDDKFDEDKSTMDGAYSIEEEDGKIKAIWMPYPEEPIIGIENIIKQVIKQLTN